MEVRTPDLNTKLIWGKTGGEEEQEALGTKLAEMMGEIGRQCNDGNNLLRG